LSISRLLVIRTGGKEFRQSEMQVSGPGQAALRNPKRGGGMVP
jgi:hypothetical protein